MFSHLIVRAVLRWKAGAAAASGYAAPHTTARVASSAGEPTAMCPTPGPAEIHLSPQKCPSRVRYKAEIGPTAGNKQPRGRVGRGSGKRRFQNPSDKDDQPM